MRFIEVTLALYEEPKNVVINVAQIISIERYIIEKASFISAKRVVTRKEYRKILCRDNIHYVVSVEDAQKLIGGE